MVRIQLTSRVQCKTELPSVIPTRPFGRYLLRLIWLFRGG